MKKLTLAMLVLLFGYNLIAQNVGINNNGAAPNSNAILDVDVTTNNKGILIPRLTTAQRTAIGGLGVADEGLTVYDQTTNSYWLWDGAAWVEFTMGGTGWQITGNAGTTSGTNFLGTTDAQNLDFRTNNTLRFRVNTSGQLLSNGSGSNTLPSFSFNSDPNTGMYSNAADNLTFSAGGLRMLDLIEAGIDEVVVNEGSSDINFRVESNGDLNMLFVDGGANRVGVGTNAPSEELDVVGEIQFSGSLEPAGNAGTSGYFLESAGPNSPPVWASFSGKVTAANYQSTGTVTESFGFAFDPVILTGLSHTVNVPAGKTYKVYIDAYGTCSKTSNANNRVFAQYMIFVNGVLPANLPFVRIAIDDEVGANFDETPWQVSTVLTLTTGAYTIDVRGWHTGPNAPDITLCNASGFVGQATMNVIEITD